MPRHLLILPAAIVAIVIVVLLWVRNRPHDAPSGVPAATVRLPDLGVVDGWLNGGPLTADSLRGHPVALVIWSDIDPSDLRLLAEAQAWHDAYARYGVRVIGVHSPDLSFSADPAVPAAVARRLRVRLPIALDPGYRVRAALGADETPSIVIADKAGTVVLVAGSGETARADRVLRALARGAEPGEAPAESRPAVEASARVTRFVHAGTARVPGGPLLHSSPGKPQTFTTQFRFQEEGEPWVPYPVGRWTPGAEGVTSVRGGASDFVVLRTERGSVAAVLAPPADQVARVWILDGDDWLGPESRGEDVRADASGATYVDVDEPRLYAIARGGAHTLKLSPEAPGVTVYGFAIDPK